MAERSTHDAAEDPRNADLRVWIDGRLVPKAEAVVSVYDSGFLMGDGVWEGVRLVNHRWAFLDAHLDRLFEGARAIDLEIGHDRRALTRRSMRWPRPTPWRARPMPG